ncbi:MAG: SAM-dependent methyltransferase [Chitinophagaceae bacterium]|nr:SAM-dependent methyltransferase [Chitinophagaceae bacterium]
MHDPTFSRNPASFRDNSGFVFTYNNVLYRQINQTFKNHFEHFISSGFYEHLINYNQLIPHEIINTNLTKAEDYYLTLKPELLPFISYPYEWSFDMLKDAALLTIQLASEAIDFGMTLKDATPFNIQFHKSRMTLIDSLSFEIYNENKPWIAYRQFCESFLIPLALMHYQKIPLHPLLLAFPEGIPLQSGAALLSWRSKWNLNTYLHIHLHAAVSNKKRRSSVASNFSPRKLKNILKSLEQLIQSFSLISAPGIWGNYYQEVEQQENYIDHKKIIIDGWISKLHKVKKAVDIGANKGVFSELLASKNIYTIAADFDHFSINEIYKQVKNINFNLHPLLVDFSNPSPAIGVNNQERLSFVDRANADVVLALAVVHHLGIGKNIPFEMQIQLIKKLGKYLIIEFVSKEDEKVQLMLQDKKDIYDWYSGDQFLEQFSSHYKILDSKEIINSKRILYLMELNEN